MPAVHRPESLPFGPFPTGGHVAASALATTALATALLATTVLTGPAAGAVAVVPETRAAAAKDQPCTAQPLRQVREGDAAHGLTVSRGTKPERFTAKVLGVLRDGIAPGLDMVLIEADSPALRRTGGIWAGMSGSPVYDDRTGRLIGAVAYGLSVGPSRIAGVTPAEAMLALGGRAAPPALRQRVKLPPDVRAALAREHGVSAAQAAGGMAQLRLPVGLAGVSGAHRAAVEKRLAKRMPGARFYAAGRTRGTTAPKPSDITPGSNFAMAVAHGDVTFGGVGTTTAVCNGAAVAFGHPAFFSGRVGGSAHVADAITVQEDPTLTPFKVANIGGVVGTVDQDRLAGIRGRLGAQPRVAPVSSRLSGPAASRTGTTRVTEQDFLPDAAFAHLISNLDRVFDKVGSGTSSLTWTVRGTRAGGRTWRLTRANRFASRADITYQSSAELPTALYQLNEQPFEDVRITGVEVSGSVSDTYRQLALSQVLVRTAKGYAPLRSDRPLQVAAGDRIQLRAVLTPWRSTRRVQVDLEVPTNRAWAGAQGALRVAGGASASGSGEEEPGGPEGPGSGASSLDGLLRSLASAPRNDSVQAALSLEPSGPGGTLRSSRSRPVSDVAVGSRSYLVIVTKPRS